MASGAAVFVSLWVGVLTALEVVLEKVKDAKKRGVAAPERLVFKAGATSTVKYAVNSVR
jgi:hypothetical protein